MAAPRALAANSVAMVNRNQSGQLASNGQEKKVRRRSAGQSQSENGSPAPVGCEATT